MAVPRLTPRQAPSVASPVCGGAPFALFWVSVPLDTAEGILNGFDLLHLNIWNRHLELFLQFHDEFDEVKGIDAQILSEGRTELDPLRGAIQRSQPPLQAAQELATTRAQGNAAGITEFQEHRLATDGAVRLQPSRRFRHLSHPLSPNQQLFALTS
jgi:hypothetical protein